MKSTLLFYYRNSKSGTSYARNLARMLYPPLSGMTFGMLCFFILLSFAASAQNKVVTVPPVSGTTTWGGITFNLRTQQEIRIDTIFVNTSGTAPATVALELWYKTSPVNGQPASSEFSGTTPLWTNVVASQQVIAGTDLAPIVIPNGLIIPAGSYYGFYIGDPAFSNTGIRYASSSTIDSVTNGTVTIKMGTNIGYGWVRNGTTYNHPRWFAGGISYGFPSRATNNAGVSAFVGPVNFCSGNQDVKVKIRNSGTNVINNVNVQWSLDGVMQTPVFWSSPLDTFGGTLYPNDTTITLGNVLINTSKTLKAWTEYPNFVQDTVPKDDSITVVIAPALSGSYTINPAGSGPNNFTSFTAAANALRTKGVCGPVTITVAAGTYNEQPTFGPINGTSAINTITIDGVDTATRKLTFAGTTTAYPTLTISGVPYLTIANLAITATNATYGFGVLINGTSNGTRITKCNINAAAGATGTGSAGIVIGGSITSYSTGGKVDNITIDSNTISGGYFGVVLYQTSTSIAVLNKVLNNKILNTYQYGIYATYNSGITISGNFVNGGKYITSNYGLYCPSMSNNGATPTIISNNRVINVGAYALYVTGSGVAGNKGRIINNMLGGGMRYGSNYLCYLSGSYWSVAHNTIHRDFATTTNTYGGLYVATASGVSIMNNIFSSTKTGSAGLPLYAVSVATIDSMNYNTFYRQDTSNNQLIYVGGALNSGSFKGASGFNINSKYENPQFINDTNLNVMNGCMLGTPLPYVTTDISGQARSLSNPTTGAMEYVKLSVDVQLEAVTAPVPPLVAGYQDLAVRIRNAGSTTITSLTVSFTDNNGTPATTSWSGTLNPCDTATVVFTGFNQVNFTSTHNMVFYTSYPNGVADMNPANDTLKRTYRVALAGNYTIGGVGANYPDVASAATDLSLRGISSSVVFTVNPGTYTGQVEISNVQGTSSTRTVTFDGIDAATRIITFTGTSTTYPTVIIASSPYITLKNLTINAPNATYGFGILINGSSGWSRISKCIVNAAPGATGTASAGIVVGGSITSYSAGGRVDNLMIDSNTITGGYFGVVFYQTSTSIALLNKVLNNNVLNTYQYGIYATYNSGLTISGNLVNGGKYITSNYGLYCPNMSNNGVNPTIISNNRVFNVGSYAFYVTGSGVAGNKGRIINNMLGGGMRYGSNYLCYLSGSYWSVAHNTIHRDFTTATNSYGGLYVATASGVSIMNNIFSSTKTGSLGLPLYVVSVATIDSMNYNMFYRQDTSNNQLIYVGSALNSGSFKGASGFNTNSVYAIPAFANDTNLNITNGCVQGTPLAYVTTDIIGQSRSATNPTVGALEFAVNPLDVQLESILAPTAPPYAPGLQDLVIRVRNTGSATVTSLNASYMDNGGFPVTITWNGVLNPCDTATLVFTGMNQLNITNVHNLSVYLSYPNGLQDQNLANDTIKKVITAALSGNYTIGGTGSNYTDVLAAVADLKLKGVGGNVVFTVNPGTYTGQVEISSILGISAAKTVTFDGVDAATRIITFAGSSTTYPTVIIAGTPYVTFRNLTINATNASYGFGVLINGASDGSRISKCNINVANGASSTSIGGVVVGGSINSYSTGGKVDNITIDSNTITGGYFGIVFYQGSAAIGLQNKVLNNTILNSYQYGMYLYYNNGITVSGNFINGGKYITSNYGMYCPNLNNNGSNIVTISNNRVINVGSYALYLTGSNVAGNKGRIINNMFGGGMRYGSNYLCYLSGSYWSFAHNTVHRDFATTTNSYGGLYVASASGVSIMNNVFSSIQSGSAGLPLYTVNATTIDSMNYNVFYRQDTTNNQLIYVGSALNSGNFKGASGFNLNSVYDRPDFASDTNLVSRNGCMHGMPLAYVPTDYNGTTRSLTDPTAGAVEIVKYTEDVKIEAIAYPKAPLASGYQNVGIRVKNVGAATLTTINLSYTNNNGSPVTTSWSGSLAPCDTTTIEFNGPNQLNITSSHNMTFYSWAPNGVADGDRTNDTIRTLFLLPMNGTYTVGGTGADFATATDAANALTLAGVSGPVTLNFTPNMSFNGSFELPVISGASPANTITFNGNGDTLTGSNSTYIVSLNGTSYITFRNFNMKAYDFANPGLGFSLRNACQYVTIRNNTINMGTTSTSSLAAAIASSATTASATMAGNNARYVTIDSNTIIGGYYGISLNGDASYLNGFGHQIRNNTVRDFYVYGIYLVNADTITVLNNDVHRMNRSSVSTFYGIYLSTSRNVKVRNNKIHDAGIGTYTAYCTYVTTSVNTAGYATEFINNSTYNIPTTGTIYSYYLLGTRDNMKFYHNTVDLNLSGNTGTIRGIFISTAPTNHDFRNNILSIRGNGTGAKHLIYVSATAASIYSNNNILYMGATGGTNAVGFLTSDRMTLADWKSAALLDSNSISVNPVFTNVTNGNLMPLSINADNAGVNVGVTTDIAGATRSATTPDIGAYEFTGINGDLAIKRGMLKRSSSCYSTNDTVFISIENTLGTTVDFNLNPLTIAWNVTGPVNSNGTIVVNSGTLDVGVSDTFFASTVNMSQPGNYTLNAYIQSNMVNVSTSNDTLPSGVPFTVMPILSVLQKNLSVNSPTDTAILQAVSPLFPGGAFLFTEVCHYRGATTGVPAGGWPSYLIADDYIEITGVPNSDLGGYTLEQWDATALVSTYTFPSGTLMSPNGTAIIAVGQLGASIPVPASFYYHGNGGFTGSFDSGITPTGRILKNPGGTIVDVVTYSGSTSYTFPAAANVSPADWSGNTPVSTSTTGLRLTGADLNNATNWTVVSATVLQDPNTFNTNVPPPSPGTLTGFSWLYNGSPVSTLPRTVVGPYTTPGVYTYVARYTTVCGTFYDTVFVTAGVGVPVKLLSFSASSMGNDVDLTWRTASEKNSAYFEVFRSTDHKNWSNIGKVKAAGTSTTVKSYGLTDKDAMNLKAATIFYKLKTTDRDGSSEWSEEAVVRTATKPASFNVYPNPFSSSLTIQLAGEGDAQVVITSLQGETLLNTTVSNNNGIAALQQLDHIKPGLYFIKITQNGVSLTEKLIKQ